MSLLDEGCNYCSAPKKSTLESVTRHAGFHFSAKCNTRITGRHLGFVVSPDNLFWGDCQLQGFLKECRNVSNGSSVGNICQGNDTT